MNKKFWYTSILLLLLSGLSQAQPITPEENASLQKAVTKMVKIDARRINSPAADRVYSGPVYNVKLSRMPSPKTSLGMGRLFLVKVKNDFIEPEGTQTGKAMPNLKRAIKKSFLLKTMKDAEQLQSALDAIYKITSSSDKKVKTIIQNGDEWIFIRGNFFKKRKGFIFKVENGAITEVNYSLGIDIEK